MNRLLIKGAIQPRSSQYGSEVKGWTTRMREGMVVLSMNEIMWSISSLGNSARRSIMVRDGVGIRGLNTL